MRPGALGRLNEEQFVEQVQKSFHEMKEIGMANQQKGVQQDTAYSAIIDHMYPCPYIVFDPKGHRNILKMI